MRHNSRLPDFYTGAGLSWKVKDEPFYIFPVRDDGTPNMPKRIDCQIGGIEDETIKSTQLREGTEETVIFRKQDNKYEIGIPSLIKDTYLEDNLIHTYENCQKDDTTLPTINGRFYYGAELVVPSGMPEARIENGYKSGYTFESTDELSIEYINELIIDIDIEKLLEQDYILYDLEYGEFDNSVTHFDRPAVIFNPLDDMMVLYRYGKIQYIGGSSGFANHLRDKYGWDMSNITHPTTCKVQARIDAMESTNDVFYNNLVSEEYMDSIKEVSSIFNQIRF